MANDKEKIESSPYYVMPNDQRYPGQPVGYPDMSGRDPMSYRQIMAQSAPMHYTDVKQAHSKNPAKGKFASPGELQSMKLAK